MKKDQLIERALLWGHSPNGKVIAAINAVFNFSYPAGTNLVLEYVQKFIGLKYGAKDKCMDAVVDCAELWRITFWIWFGIDIGNFTDAQYKSKLGTTLSTSFSGVYDAHPLDLIFYDTSSSKITGHVSAKFDDSRIFHSGAKENRSKVNFSLITWGKKDFICVRRFLSDEQIKSVTIGGNPPVSEPKKWTCSRVLKLTLPRMKGRDVYDLEMALEAQWLDCGMTKKEHADKIGIFGPMCNKALREWQKKNPECGDSKGRPDGEAGERSITKLGGIWQG